MQSSTGILCMTILPPNIKLAFDPIKLSLAQELQSVKKGRTEAIDFVLKGEKRNMYHAIIHIYKYMNKHITQKQVYDIYI